MKKNKAKSKEEKPKKKKNWHHDIKQIDGRWVEDVVADFQAETDVTKKEILLDKIMKNYEIFRNKCALDYSKHLGGDIEAGRLIHDEIVWKAASKFDMSKAEKEKGYAFNAFLVATQCNHNRNLNNTKVSKKNHPRIKCPICNEEVYQIDVKHLRHRTDVEMYEKLHPGQPLVSYTGVLDRKTKKSEQKKYYTVVDFSKDYGHLLQKFPIQCPMSGQKLFKVTAQYPSMLVKGYTEEDFIQDFPDFPIITCPFTGKKKLEITQEYLDQVLMQTPPVTEVQEEISQEELIRQVKVTNPYTGQQVDEITLEMLADAGTDLRTHIYKFATIELEKKYKDKIPCPFTGEMLKQITVKKLEKMGISEWEFYMATCRFPLRKYQVKCALDNKWVDNIWSHLEKKVHNYAKPYSMDDFEKEFNKTPTKAFVSTNCYFESDSGDQMHISDLFVNNKNENDAMEIEDSLLVTAQDELDKAIITSLKQSHTVEDVYYHSSVTKEINLKMEGNPSTKELKSEIKKIIGINDFDITVPVLEEKKDSITIMIPSRDTIRKRLQRMMQASDIG